MKRGRVYWLGIAALILLAMGVDWTSARRAPRVTKLLVDAVTTATPPENSVVGIVQSSHSALSDPVPIDQPLNYEQIREMVWTAIEYGHPKSGGLGTITPQDAWVVIKPNIVHIRPQQNLWRVGNTTDLRVVKAVFEYVAEQTFAGRITLAEGGSYRGREDNRSGAKVSQDGQRVDAYTVDWGDAYPGFTGTIQGMLEELGERYPDRQFDYVDLNYDTVRDRDGDPVAYEVPVSETGVGAISPRTEYYITNTIVNCDVLISVPVMKVHPNPGVTAVFKNYVGTAPREIYATSGSWWNANLHNWHTIDKNMDPAICDLAAFHPPDFAVVDGIRGLQSHVHNNNRPDQVVRRNVIVAGEDPVAVDGVVSTIMGFNPGDMNYLRFAAARGMGTFDLGFITVRGDPVEEVKHDWIKAPSSENYGLSFYYGRGNHTWLLNGVYQGDLDTDFLDGEAGILPKAGEWSGGEMWDTEILVADKLNLKQYVFDKYGNYDLLQDAVTYAATYVYSKEAQPANLWVGVDNGVVGYLNGQEVLREYNNGNHRFAQYRVPVDLLEGQNVLLFKVSNDYGNYDLSAALVDMNDDGDTAPGIWWSTEPFEVAVEEGAAWTRPRDYVLKPNYPNPFNASTTIRYALPRESQMELAVYDLLGRRIRTLAEGIRSAGWHTARWDGQDGAERSVASGLYIYTLSAETDQGLVEMGTGRMTLLK